jgi:antitoxin YefM
LRARVLGNAELVAVETMGGRRVVVVPLEDCTSWQDTPYLLKNPTDADHLRTSIAEAEAGKAPARELID